MPNNMPPDPITPMHQMAGTIKEYYDALCAVGFNHASALYLTGEWVKAMQQVAAQNSGPNAG